MMYRLKCPYPDCNREHLIDVNSFGTMSRTCMECKREIWYRIKEILVEVTPAKVRGETIPASAFHDAGAYAKCSYCGRYTDDPHVFKNTPMCDCGSTEGWSGSFVPPTSESEWSSHYPRQSTRKSIWVQRE